MGTWEDKYLVTEYNGQNIIFITNDFVVGNMFLVFMSVCMQDKSMKF